MNSESDLQALQNDLATKFQLQGGSTTVNSEPDVLMAHRKVSVGYQEERLLSQSKYLLSTADRKNILQQSETLKTLYDDMAKALPYQNHGTDLIIYLIGKNKSANRSQAIAMLTAMLEAGYITEIDGIGPNAAPVKAAASNPFGDSDSNSYWSSDTDIFNEFNEHGMYKLLRVNEIMTNSGTFQLNVDVDSSSVFVSRPDEQGTGQEHVIRSVFEGAQYNVGRFTGVDGMGGQRESNFNLTEMGEMDLDDSVVSSTGSKSLQEAYCRHEELLLCKPRASRAAIVQRPRHNAPITYTFRTRISLQLSCCAPKTWTNRGQRRSFRCALASPTRCRPSSWKSTRWTSAAM